LIAGFDLQPRDLPNDWLPIEPHHLGKARVPIEDDQIFTGLTTDDLHTRAAKYRPTT
jgi:hypothetical protein